MTNSSESDPVRRFVCIHGHFYQPPREDPWLESIPIQPSAAPFKNWNERIDAECFGANANSRILGERDQVTRILNNYSHISFNFGPTLLCWLEQSSPATYEAILQADRESIERFSGHGSALAQAYNHTILPLATRRDKEIQVGWGIRDFHRHFKRDPEGMWLPETAVDTETLEVLAEHGIQFTILAPYQAARILSVEDSSTESIPPVDIRRPYWFKLPSGRRIALFFYNGGLAQAVAFEGLLLDGRQLANRLVDVFSDEPVAAELSHIATDGETYGHHHRHGEMALAFALETLKANPSVELTNYGQFLERFPPTDEIGIVERTSWSCAHGVGRWREDCGCCTGYNPSWNQQWRMGLREALDHLSVRCVQLYQQQAGNLLKDPEAALDAYGGVIARIDEQVRDAFLDEHLLPEADRTRALRLLEMRRHCQLMFTSCAWFFDEVSGIEPVQILHYAARAIELARKLGVDFEEEFVAELSAAKSNLPEQEDASRIYRERVLASSLDAKQLAAHAAFLALVESSLDALFPAYCIDFSNLMRSEVDNVLTCTGRLRIETIRTAARYRFGFLSVFEPTGICRAFVREERPDELEPEGELSWGGLSSDELQVLAEHPEIEAFDLESLSSEVQTAVMEAVGERVRGEKLALFQTFLEKHKDVLHLFGRTRVPLPPPLPTVVESVLREEAPGLIQSGGISLLRRRMNEAHTWGVDFSLDGWHALLARHLSNLALSSERTLEDRLRQVLEGLRLTAELKIPMDRGPLQRWFYDEVKALAGKPELLDADLEQALRSVSEALLVELPESLQSTEGEPHSELPAQSFG